MGPAGVQADTLDRRWLLIAVQTAMAAIGTLLAVLTFSGQMAPALLLVLIFLFECAPHSRGTRRRTGP